MSEFHLFDVTNSIDHELEAGQTVIGRGADCSIRLLSSSVSRKHGVFDLADGTLTYSDSGSSNGSFVNGQSVQAPTRLNNGDELLLGELRLMVRREGEAADAAHDEDATQLAGSTGESGIPATCSERPGLEQASGTQFFAEGSTSAAAEAYHRGEIPIPPLGDAPRLVGLTGDSKGKAYELGVSGAGADHTWKLGREAPAVDLVIADGSVSAQHAQLVHEGGRWKIVNWMSTNGTFVNGQKGLSTYLQSGDVIRMGSAELAFELPQGRAPGKARKVKSRGIPRWLARLFGKGN